MKKIFQKQREAIIVVVYIVLIMALVYFIVFPLLSHINEVKDQIQQESADQEILKQQINDLPRMQKQYEMLEQNKESVDILLDKNNAVVLIERLEKLADDTGNKIIISVQDQTQIQTSQQKSASSSKKAAADEANALVNALPSQEYLKIKIELTGKYNTIVNFIDSLESLNYYSDVTGIQMTKSDESKQVSGVGIVFGSMKSINDAKNTPKVSGDLKATIDAVFYTKK